jgi:excisionase family DNA binding protein
VAAEMLGISTPTVWRWLKNNKMRAMKVGAVVRIPLSEIYRLVGDPIPAGDVSS